MKRILLLILCLLGSTIIIGQASADVNGELILDNEIPVLRVWGTHYEMGYAHGYLMGDRILHEFDGFILPLTLHNPNFYQFVLDKFQDLYTIPEKYTSEAQGLIDGAIDAGFDLYIPMLGRELSALDIEATGAMPDLIGLVSCSTLMAWGEATRDDPELAGMTALVRNMDWLAIPSDPTFLARQTVLIARSPNEGRKTISIYYPGLIGCLSCMNDAGVSALQHQVHPGVLFYKRDYSEKFIPINIAMREGLELFDPDGDGLATTNDVAIVVEALPKSSQYNIVLADMFEQDHPPFILETANNGSTRRYFEDDPDFPPMTLGATNHFRKLKSPHYCSRYGTIRDNANQWHGGISLQNLWENNNQVAMTFPLGSITAQTMIFLPSLRRIAVAYSDEHLFAPEKEPVWFEWSELFPFQGTPHINDDDDVPDGDDADENETGEMETTGCCAG